MVEVVAVSTASKPLFRLLRKVAADAIPGPISGRLLPSTWPSTPVNSGPNRASNPAEMPLSAWVMLTFERALLIASESVPVPRPLEYVKELMGLVRSSASRRS